MSLSIAQSIYENASKVSPTVTRMTGATARSTASQGPSGLVAANDLSLFSTTTMTTSVVESNRFLPASAANSSAAAAAAMLRNGQDERQHNPLALGLGLGLGVGLAVLGLMVVYFVLRARREERVRHETRASQMGLKRMSPGYGVGVGVGGHELDQAKAQAYGRGEMMSSV